MIRYQLDITPGQFLFGLVVFFLIASCNIQQGNIPSNVKFSRSKDGSIKTLKIIQNNKEVIFRFDKLGNCEQIEQYKNHLRDGEQLSFFHGALIQKAWYSLNLPNGYLFDFYSNSGALKSYRQLSFGKERDLGLEYYNAGVPVIKSSLYFNNNGEIYFKQNFDSMSNFVSEEGKKPEFLKH
jgi:antitoxin component YwqK of YwqJK toxin-antitoxin module